jgi:Gram-negative bacterial TonB protein C-terminal
MQARSSESAPRFGERNMDLEYRRFLALLAFSIWLTVGAQGSPQTGGDLSQNTQKTKLPTDVILVKGAWPSASDSVTPLPEGGGIVSNVYKNDYFRLAYPLPQDWTQKYSGPPPSDSGSYVLAQIRPADVFPGTIRGSILISAQDLFFTLTHAGNALELINYTKNHLNADYEVEQPPTEVHIANHSFIRFDYFSPVAELHWHVLATQIRCHVVQFVFTSRDTDLIENLIQQMNTMKLPTETNPTSGTGGGDAPVCIKDYARGENVVEREDPILAERTFNPVPVRIIIDKEGKIKHIHFLSAFPSQAKSITDALQQWRFKPYLRDGKPVEVETGIRFGYSPQPAISSDAHALRE